MNLLALDSNFQVAGVSATLAHRARRAGVDDAVIFSKSKALLELERVISEGDAAAVEQVKKTLEIPQGEALTTALESASIKSRDEFLTGVREGLTAQERAALDEMVRGKSEGEVREILGTNVADAQLRVRAVAQEKVTGGPRAGEDLEAWAARLKAAGLKGDVDAIVERAKGTGSDAMAARGELRAAERAMARGHQVEMLTPPSGAGAVQGKKTPEAKLSNAGVDGALEVKTATDPPDRKTWNKHADKANEQIKASGTQGEISFDWTDVNIAAGGDFQTGQPAIEAFLNGKMTRDRLRNVRYFEIVWRDASGKVRKTTRTRADDGTVGPVVTR